MLVMVFVLIGSTTVSLEICTISKIDSEENAQQNYRSQVNTDVDALFYIHYILRLILCSIVIGRIYER